MEMRKALHNALANVMRKNDKVCVIDADLAKANGTWDLRNEFPERALDVGIAENNMASVAAGTWPTRFISRCATPSKT